MRKLITITGILSVFLFTPLKPVFSEDTARDHMHKGIDYYKSGKYQEAEKAFETAAKDAQKSKLDPAAARYNQGNALMKSDRPQDAAAVYTDALRSTDLGLQAKAYFNRGNALFRMAGEEGQQQQMDTAVKAIEEAVSMYENAIALDPSDIDSKINFELALKKKEELKKQQQEQQKNQDQKKNDKDQQKQNQKDQNQQQQKDQKKDQQKDQQKQSQQDQKDKQKDKQDQQSQQNNQQQNQNQMSQNEQQQQPKKSEEMTKEEAQVMLNAMRDEEKSKRERMRLMMGEPVPVEKDW